VIGHGLHSRVLDRPEFAIALLLVLAGFAGLWTTPGPQSAASTLLGLAFGQLPAAFDTAQPPVLLAVAALTIPPLEGGLILALVWAAVRQPLRLRLIRARGDHCVIAGDSALAGLVVAHELDRRGAVVLWLADRRAAWVRPALRRKVAYVALGDPAQTVGRLGLDKARTVVLLCETSPENARLALLALAQAGRDRPAGDPLPVIARVDDAAVQASLEVQMTGPAMAGVGKSVARLRFASLPGIAARQLFLEWPIDRFRRQGDTGRRVLAFGFTPAIEAYVLRVLAGNHFRDGVRPQFVVIVPDAQAAAARFREVHPGADTLSPVLFEDGVPDGFGALIARHGDPVAVLVDTGDPANDGAVVAAIDRHYRSSDLAMPLVHVRAAAGDGQTGPMVHAFGALDAFTEPDFLMQERHDALARSIHDFYLEGRLSEGDRIGSRGSMHEWEDLGETFRDDNRLVADCYQLKLRDIGARIIADRGPPLRLDADELEELARAEHDRWTAAKLSDGWVHGAQRDDARRVHPDIVAYDALSERIKDLDREQVRVMTRLLASTGARTLRVLTIAIEPGAVGVVAGLPRLLAQIAVHWPDRVVVLAASLGDAGSRASLAASDTLIRLIVPGHAGRLLEGLASDDRAGAAALLARADSIVGLGAHEDARAAIVTGADLLVAGTNPQPARCPVVRLAPDGRIVAAPWLATGAGA
jgi:hypothetical protein